MCDNLLNIYIMTRSLRGRPLGKVKPQGTSRNIYVNIYMSHNTGKRLYMSHNPP